MSGGVPFAWQDKRVLRKIREEIPDYGSALAVYLALTVVASDKQADEFQTTHQWLSQISGFCEKTVRMRLQDLGRIGAVEVTTAALKAPSTYKLRPISNDSITFGSGCRTFGNEYRASGNGCRALGNGQPSALPTSEEKKKEKGEANPKQLGTAARIAIKDNLNILRGRLEGLKERTSEQWQREQYPELVKQRRELESQIKEIENQHLKG